MRNAIQIIPAIIPKDLDDMQSHLKRVHGIVDRVQIDIIDGAYAPTKTWPYVGDRGEFERLIQGEEGLPYWEDFSFEIDLMVQNPENEIEKWFNIGASTLIIHAGSTTKLKEIRTQLTEWNIEMGIAFKPSEEIKDELVKIADFIQIMGNDKIGYHGVELDVSVYEKILKLHARYPELVIAVDIGVNEETAHKLKEVGVTKLVSGSTIFKSDTIRETITYLEHV